MALEELFVQRIIVIRRFRTARSLLQIDPGQLINRLITISCHGINAHHRLPPPARRSHPRRPRRRRPRAFGDKGYDAASTREIAAAAERQRGDDRLSFRRQGGAQAACADFVAERLTQIFASPVAPPRERRRGPAGAIGLGRARDPRRRRRRSGAAAGALSMREIADPSPAFARVFETAFAPLHKRACRSGRAPPAADPASEETRLRSSRCWRSRLFPHRARASSGAWTGATSAREAARSNPSSWATSKRRWTPQGEAPHDALRRSAPSRFLACPVLRRRPRTPLSAMSRANMSRSRRSTSRGSRPNPCAAAMR